VVELVPCQATFARLPGRQNRPVVVGVLA